MNISRAAAAAPQPNALFQLICTITFAGMRGKKLLLAPVDEPEFLLQQMAAAAAASKRAGFMGMRGKKSGNGEMDEDDDNADEFDSSNGYVDSVPEAINAYSAKRAGFVGMRGKRPFWQERPELSRNHLLNRFRKSAGFMGMRGRR